MEDNDRTTQGSASKSVTAVLIFRGTFSDGKRFFIAAICALYKDQLKRGPVCIFINWLQSQATYYKVILLNFPISFYFPFPIMA